MLDEHGVAFTITGSDTIPFDKPVQVIFQVEATRHHRRGREMLAFGRVTTLQLV